jgi:hypothetical protein
MAINDLGLERLLAKRRFTNATLTFVAFAYSNISSLQLVWLISGRLEMPSVSFDLHAKPATPSALSALSGALNTEVIF